MNSYAQLKQQQQSRAVANTHLQKGQDSVAPGRQVGRLGGLQESVNLNPEVRHVTQMRALLNARSPTTTPLRQKANHTGLPDRLKAGIERVSNFSMDDVKVKYNSSRPAQFKALAITQGKEIHVGPGQERHLPHEAWHLVQQKQGRVRATMQMRGALINDDSRLEREADVMGAIAARAAPADAGQAPVEANQHSQPAVAQRVVEPVLGTDPRQYRSTFIYGETFPSEMAAQVAEAELLRGRFMAHISPRSVPEVLRAREHGTENLARVQHAMQRDDMDQFWENLAAAFPQAQAQGPAPLEWGEVLPGWDL